jgi:hypothetical protein
MTKADDPSYGRWTSDRQETKKNLPLLKSKLKDYERQQIERQAEAKTRETMMQAEIKEMRMSRLRKRVL